MEPSEATQKGIAERINTANLFGEFQKVLAELINTYGLDAMCNIPHYILADYIMSTIDVFYRTRRKIMIHEGYDDLNVPETLSSTSGRAMDDLCPIPQKNVQGVKRPGPKPSRTALYPPPPPPKKL